MSANGKGSRAATLAAGCLALVVCTILTAGAAPRAGAPAARKAPATAPAPKPKPTTCTVKRGPLKIEIKAKGLLAAKTTMEVALHPEAWLELVVLSAAEPGTLVKEGEPVLTLETEKIDESIRALGTAQELSEASLKLAEADLAAAAKLQPIDLAAAERAKKAADEDLERYVKIERPMNVKSVKFALKRAEDLLAYQKEELRQLEKMYKADDLTEETEEIILKRQRDAVGRAQFAVEAAKIKADRELNVDLPRRDITVKDAARRQAIALAKTQASAAATLTKAHLELAKQKRAHKLAAEKLGKLKKDRRAMVVKSTVEGMVYPGPCVNGTWPKLGQRLKPGEKVLPRDVVMTIVPPGPMVVQATVPEKDLQHLEAGAQGRVVPTARPDLALKAKVERISPIPVSAGQFALTLSVDSPKGAARLRPGMGCSVTLVPYAKKHALAVPAAAVFADERDGTRTYVYVRKKGGGHRKVPVEVVKRAGKRVEVKGPLPDGTVLLLVKPKEDK